MSSTTTLVAKQYRLQEHPSIKYKELIERFAEIELDLKVIALNDTTEVADKLNIEIAIQELKGLLDKKGTSGQLDQE